MKQACQIAQADDFIESFPDKYNTKLDEGGTNVSGGQKQRICIARALLKNPKILILDDSTSAVDTHTDSLIREGLKKKTPGHHGVHRRGTDSLRQGVRHHLGHG
jgi:ATP-binding cassette subfamily B protein